MQKGTTNKKTTNNNPINLEDETRVSGGSRLRIKPVGLPVASSGPSGPTLPPVATSAEDGNVDMDSVPSGTTSSSVATPADAPVDSVPSGTTSVDLLQLIASATSMKELRRVYGDHHEDFKNPSQELRDAFNEKADYLRGVLDEISGESTSVETPSSAEAHSDEPTVVPFEPYSAEELSVEELSTEELSAEAHSPWFASPVEGIQRPRFGGND